MRHQVRKRRLKKCWRLLWKAKPKVLACADTCWSLLPNDGRSDERAIWLPQKTWGNFWGVDLIIAGVAWTRSLHESGLSSKLRTPVDTVPGYRTDASEARAVPLPVRSQRCPCLKHFCMWPPLLRPLPLLVASPVGWRIGSSPFWHLLMWPKINTAGLYTGSTTTYTQPLDDTQCMVCFYLGYSIQVFPRNLLGRKATQISQSRPSELENPIKLATPPAFLEYTPPGICFVGDLLMFTMLKHDSTTIWEILVFAFWKHQTSKSKPPLWGVSIHTSILLRSIFVIRCHLFRCCILFNDLLLNYTLLVKFHVRKVQGLNLPSNTKQREIFTESLPCQAILGSFSG